MDNGFKVGPYILPIHKETVVMGILNVTPDSFSDGGKYQKLDQALFHAEKMVKDGAKMIDIGGESTRPGSNEVSEEEELERVIPVIEALTREIPVPLSIDTYKGEVAHQSIQAGAHIINDVWGGKRDPIMPQVMAECNVPVILMHNRTNVNYVNFVDDVVKDLQESINLVKKAGLADDKIILDPGMGFAKEYEHNMELMAKLECLVHMGYPVLLATSRKRFIGHTLDLPVEERVEGTLATVALGIMKGCHMVRVHDVKETVRLSRMMNAMLSYS